jgi:hypothetical protein
VFGASLARDEYDSMVGWEHTAGGTYSLSGNS